MNRLIILLFLMCGIPAADVTLPALVTTTTTYGSANASTSNSSGTVFASPAIVTVKTGRLVLNNFKVASGAGFKCQLVPYFPAAPTASPSPVTAKTTTLFVTPVQWYLGENTVTYSWAKTSGPGTVTFVAGAAMPDLRKTWTATFSLSGTYVLTVTATGADGSANIYPVTVTVNVTKTDVVVTPATASPVRGGLVAFTGTSRDQFGTALADQPAITWSVSPTSAGTFLSQGDYVLEASGTDIWGTNDGFRFLHQEMTGDGTITAKVEAPLENTHAWAKAGVMIRNGLADNAVNAMANVTAGAGALFQRRLTAGATSSNNITTGLVAPYWVRLTRLGNTLTGYASPDGSVWTQLGTDTVTMSPTVRVGLAVTSHQPGVRAQARFSNVSITPAIATAGALPSGWTQQDIAITTPAGSGTYTPSTGTYTIQAAGADIWGTSDQFRFVHRPLPAGDVTLIARVASLTNTHASAKAGLMIRDGLSADAINVLVNVTPGTGGVAFQRRTSVATSTLSTAVSGLGLARWLKLTRVGTTVTTYTSSDGKAWRNIGSASVTMGATLYAGLAVTSHNATTLTTAMFDNVQILTGTNASALATPQWPWQTQDVGTVVLAGSAYTTTAPGVFWAGQTLGGPYPVTATAATVPTAGAAQVSITNGTPIISIAAKSSASPITGTTTTLTTYGDDDAGEPGLTYTWTITGTPPATPAYSANSTNAAKTTTATFTKAGTYTFRVTATDANGAVSAPSDVTVIVNQTATSVAVTSSPVVIPSPVSVITNTTQQFSAVLRDQFNAAMAAQPPAATGWTWSIPSGGTISSTGLFTAGATVGGPFTISTTAIASAKIGTIQVNVVAPPSIAIAATDATATELSTPADNGVFTLTRTGILTVPVTVTLTTTGTATAGTDYTALPTTVTIPANATTAAVTVVPLNDSTAEVNKTIIATVAASSGYTVGSPSSATVTLIDDEQRVSIAATDATASEATTITDTGTFTITRTGTTAAALSVFFTVSGTATSVSDFGALTSPVVIPAGALSTTITVTPVDNTTGEPSETVIATLATNAAYTIVGSAATITINDNDAVVTIAATDATATESTTATDKGTFTITRTGATTAALTVNLTTTGTATATADFTALPATVTIPINSTSTTVTVTPVDNTTAEPNETVILTVAAGTGYTPGTPSAATVTIIDDEQGVSIAATDATASEATTVTDTGTFTIMRTGITTNSLTVNLTTSGTASAGTDFTALPTTVVIAAGASSATVTATPLNDTAGEPNETIVLTVAAGTSYTVSTPNAATMTLVDDDQRVTIAATDATATETSGNTDKGTFTITRTGTTTAALTVNFTVTGTTVAGDYTSIGASVIVPANATTTTITVSPIDDTAYEGSETVIVTLAANAAYTVGTPNHIATVTITDNDLPTVTIAATDASAAEPSNNGIFTLTRSGITTGTLTVTVTKGGTTSASDHNTLPATVTFNANQATATVTLTPVNDTELEATETATLTIATGTGYNVGSPNSATVTLLDDEQGITITATDATASEPSTDTGTFTITRTSGVLTSAFTVNLTPGGTASVTADYQPLPTTVAFAANQTTATVTVTPVDNTTSEPDKTVTLTIAPGTGYLPGSPSTATVTITDNDGPTVGFLAATSSVSEGGIQLDIPVVLSLAHSQTVTVVYALTGTATGNGDDYYLPNGTLTFAAGETSKILCLQVRDDAAVEANETAIITLSAPVNGALATIKVHTVTISDNDAITVQVAATDPVVNEDGTHYGAVTFTRTGSLAAALTANLSLTGSTAIVGTDYTDPTDSGTKITFPAGVASVTRAVVAKQDSLHEADETIVVTVIAGTGYAVGTPSVATLTIHDDDVVTIAATTPRAAEAATPTNGVFTISRVGTTGNLTVAVAISGTAATADYTRTPTGTTVVIPAGQTSVTMTITPVQDSAIEGPETVIAEIIPTTPTATYTIGAAASATVTITDDDVPTLTISSATDATAVEPGGDNATFTITRPAATTAALTVTYQISGTATPGLDYTALSGTATIAANAASTTVTLTALGDQSTEADETVILTLIGRATYNVGTTPSASATIKDCTLTIAATDAEVKEPNTNNKGTIRITRNNSSAAPLVVPVQWSGSATLNTDFTASPAVTTSSTIPANATFVDIAVAAKADGLVEGPESAILALQPSTTTPFAVTGAWSASTLIVDATLTITASRTEVTENANEQVELYVTRTGDFSGPALNVAFALSGATPDVDYSSSVPSGTLVIATGNASAPSVTITTNHDDATIEGDETITATIGPSSYGIIASSVAITLRDDDIPTVDLTISDAAVSEAGPDSGTFTLTRSGPTTNPLTVTLTRTGSAIAVSDYTATPASITGTGTITVPIPAGQESAQITITPINDSTAEIAETVILSLVPQPTYRVGQGQSQISISDNETPVVTIAASSAEAAEDGALGVFTIQRAGDPTTSISVGISTTGSTATAGSDYTTLTGPIVLGPNVTTKEIYVVPVDNALTEANETVKVTLSSGSGYSLGATTNATVTITDNDLPTVTVAAHQPNAAEGTTPVAGIVRFARTGGTTTTLSVPFTRGGTASATLGTDYTLNPSASTITFAIGAATADLVITPVNNTTATGNKSVIVTLGTGAFTPGEESSATLTIADDERPTIDIVATDGSANETGPDTAAFVVSRSAASGSALVIPYTINGQATAAIDCLPLSGSVTILANQTSATITITPRDDADVEPAESLILTLGVGSGYVLDTNASTATITILSNDLPAPTVTYQYGKGLVAEASGRVPGGHDITALLATTATSGVTLTTQLVDGGFLVRGSLASAGITNAPISLRYQDARGVLGPQTTVVAVWPSGSGTMEQGDAEQAFLAPPGVTISLADATLTGKKTATISGQQVFYSKLTSIQVTASIVSNYGLTSVGELQDSMGGTYPIVGGVATMANPPEGRHELTAVVTHERAGQRATGVSNTLVLIVDRSPPVMDMGLDISYWDQESIDDPNGWVKLVKVSYDAQQNSAAVFAGSVFGPLNTVHINAMDESFNAQNSARKNQQYYSYSAGFDPLVRVIDLSGMREDAGLGPKFSDPKLAMSKLPARSPAGAGVEVWQLNGLLNYLPKNSGSYAGLPSVTGEDNCGNAYNAYTYNSVTPYFTASDQKPWAGRDSSYQAPEPGYDKYRSLIHDVREFGYDVQGFNELFVSSRSPGNRIIGKFIFPSGIAIPAPTGTNQEGQAYVRGAPAQVTLVAEDAMGNESDASVFLRQGRPYRTYYHQTSIDGGGSPAGSLNGQSSGYANRFSTYDSGPSQGIAFEFIDSDDAHTTAEKAFPTSPGLLRARLHYNKQEQYFNPHDVSFGSTTSEAANFVEPHESWGTIPRWMPTWLRPVLPGSGATRRAKPSLLTVEPQWRKNVLTTLTITDECIGKMPSIPDIVASYIQVQVPSGGWAQVGDVSRNGAVVQAKIPTSEFTFDAGPADVSYGASDLYGPDLDDGDGYWNTGVAWVSLINLSPRVVRTGNEVDLFITANYLDAVTAPSDFNQSGDYVRFLRGGTDVTVSYEKWSSMTPEQKAGTGDKVVIKEQAFLMPGRSGSVRQAIRLKVAIGEDVLPDLLDVEVKFGAVSYKAGESAAGSQGRNGSHKMSEAFSVCRMMASPLSLWQLQDKPFSIRVAGSGGRGSARPADSWIDIVLPHLSDADAKKLVTEWWMPWPLEPNLYLLQGGSGRFKRIKGFDMTNPYQKFPIDQSSVRLLGGAMSQEFRGVSKNETFYFSITPTGSIPRELADPILGSILLKRRTAVVELTSDNTTPADKTFLKAPAGSTTLFGNTAAVSFQDVEEGGAAAPPVPDLEPTLISQFAPSSEGANELFGIAYDTEVANALNGELNPVVDARENFRRQPAPILKWNNSKSFVIGGETVGDSIIQIFPRIDDKIDAGKDKALVEIPIQVDMPLLLEPAVYQLGAAWENQKLRNEFAQLAGEGNDLHQRISPLPPANGGTDDFWHLPDQDTEGKKALRLNASQTFSVGTKNTRGLDGAFELAMFIAGQIANRPKAAGTPQDWREPLQALYTIPVEWTDSGVSTSLSRLQTSWRQFATLVDGQVVAAASVDGAIAARFAHAKHGAPPYALWERFARRIPKGGNGGVKVTREDPSMVRQRIALEVRLKGLLDMAAGLRLRRYFSLYDDYSLNPSSLSLINSGVFFVDSYAKCVGTDVKIDLKRDWFERVGDWWNGSSPMTEMFNTAVTPNWFVGHSYVEDTLRYMIAERSEWVRKLLPTLPGNGSDQFPIQIRCSPDIGASFTVPLEYAFSSQAGVGDRVRLSLRNVNLVDTGSYWAIKAPSITNPNSFFAVRGFAEVRDGIDVTSPNGFKLRVKKLSQALNNLIDLPVEIVATDPAVNSRATIVAQLMSEIHVLENFISNQDLTAVTQAMAQDNLTLYQGYKLGELVTPVPDLYKAMWGNDPETGRYLEGPERWMCGIMAGISVVTSAVPAGKTLLMSRDAGKTVESAAFQSLDSGLSANKGLVKDAMQGTVEGVETAVVNIANRPGWKGLAAGALVQGTKRVVGWAAMKIDDLITLQNRVARYHETIAVQTGAGAAHVNPMVALETAAKRVAMHPYLVREVRRLTNGQMTKRSAQELSDEICNPSFREQLANAVRGHLGATDEAAEIIESITRLPGCFPAGTPVVLASGQVVPIESIVVGDRVQTRLEILNEGPWVAGKVDSVSVREVKVLTTAWLMNAAGELKRFVASPEHPVFVDGRGWLEIGLVEEGTRLVGGSETWMVADISTSRQFAPIKVYNFSVTGTATYCVAMPEGGFVWVHNATCEKTLRVMLGEANLQLMLKAGKKGAEEIKNTLAAFKAYIRDGESFFPVLKRKTSMADDLVDNASTILANRLKDLYFKLGTISKHAAHHLIPSKVAKKYQAFLEDIGYAHNAVTNGTLLPEKYATRGYFKDLINAATRHSGNHGGYNYAIYKRMGEIMEKYKKVKNANPKPTKSQENRAAATARKEVAELQDKARATLHRESNKIELVGKEADATQAELYKQWAKEFGVRDAGGYLSPSKWPDPDFTP